MTRRLIAPLVALMGAAVVTLSAAPINLTGTWQPEYWTVKIGLHQEGDRVWGYGGAKNFWFRGHWDGNLLLLVANNFQEKRTGACKPHGVFTLTGTTVTNLRTVWLQPNGRRIQGQWMLLSPDAGEAIPYPYVTELTYCGFLRTYELMFAGGSDKLVGTDWPILAAVSEVLKSGPSMKIEIAGHTDSSGDAGKNKDLSERRAATVKRTLVDRYGGDAARISTRGWGTEQPVADNKTDDGRALNRRVEIVLAR